MRAIPRWIQCLGALVMLVACTGESIVGGRDSGMADRPTDLGPQCAAGQTPCGSVCVDLQANRDNCGACGTVCQGGLVCVAGSCTISCPTGQTLCGNLCVTTGTDRTNCGACGRTCAAGQVCSNGTCAVDCAADLATCTSASDSDAGTDGGGARYCANVSNDRENCGACGTACAAGQICAAGACVTSCGAGTTACGGA